MVFNGLKKGPVRCAKLWDKSWVILKNLASINILFLDSQPSTPPPPPLPRMKKKDMTLTELKKYDGSDPDGRVCVAVLGKIYDVTKGKRFYGPGNKIFLNLLGKVSNDPIHTYAPKFL